MKFTYQEQRDYETIESEIAALEEKIEMLDQEMAAASTDFVKLNQTGNRKRGDRKAVGRKDGQMDVFRRSGGKDCGAVEKNNLNKIL